MSDDFDITLERELESNGDCAAAGVSEVRRIELITGSGRRRRWSRADKARIVVETLEPGANVSEVARQWVEPPAVVRLAARGRCDTSSEGAASASARDQ